MSPTALSLRRVRALFALLVAVTLVLGHAPTTGAQEPEPPRWQSTDPSAEEAHGELDASHLEGLEGELAPFGPDAATPLDEPDDIVVEDGVTQPVFSYADAIRETVQIPGAVGSENSGETDVINVDIIRPAASDGEVQVPTIIVPSPYYQSPGRGRAGETKPAGGPIDFFPLYYDNYFVPRGYAVALVDLAGTRGSTGCLDIGGPAEIDNTVRFVEWLTGDASGFDVDGDEVTADWSNGLSGMVGKSWDGTVANGVASRGVDGLATIVPIEGISGWYHWFWQNGARFTGHSPLSLANAIRNVPGARCSDVNADLAAGNTLDPTTDFWTERDFIKDADQVQASVFVVHGLNDYNVKPLNYGYWWDALAEHDVPRKIWLSQVGHEKGFDFRRDEWLDTIHRWFDHWLHEIDNGIMDEPMADVEYAPDQWATYDTWPGGSNVTARFGQPTDEDDPRQGVLGHGNVGRNPSSMTFTELRRPHDNAAQNPFDHQDTRLVFMTDELSESVRISGTPRVSLRASIDGDNSHLGAYLVDYGTATRTNWPVQGGVLDLDTVTCFGEGTGTDTGCYRDVERRTRTRDFEVVARGWMNAQFITGEDSFDPDESYRLQWDIQTDDYLFEEGHRIGIVVTGVDSTAIASHNTNGTPVEVHLNGSHVHLPVVGGTRAFRSATN